MSAPAAASWRVELRDGALRVAFSDRESEDIALADAPDLVAALLKRGRVDAARAVVAGWFVSLAQAAGLDNVSLGP